jgi:5S rRNA maturation endonuclease (ribonuclease M5)
MAEVSEFDSLFHLLIGTDSIQKSREKLNSFVKHMLAQPWQDEQIHLFAELRQLQESTLHDAESFMFVDDFVLPPEFDTEDLKLWYFLGRYCYPVKSAAGNIIGIVGYDMLESPKYLDSENYGYKAKDAVFFGMEKIPDYYSSTDSVIITEGSVCMLGLRENGFQAMAMLGSSLSPYMIKVLRRFGRRCVLMPDSDDAGSKILKQAKWNLPDARVIRVTSAKDLDDSRKVNPNFYGNLRKMLDNTFISLPL